MVAAVGEAVMSSRARRRRKCAGIVGQVEAEADNALTPGLDGLGRTIPALRCRRSGEGHVGRRALGLSCLAAGPRRWAMSLTVSGNTHGP